jgi:hypothetical protein
MSPLVDISGPFGCTGMPLSGSVVIEPRFQGIPKIALGGYVGGFLARELTGAEAVFRRPVPLGQPLRVDRAGGQETALLNGEELLTTVRPAQVDLRVPPALTMEESEAASSAYPGFTRHLFPNCFTCGPARSEGDGLRVFAGPVAGREVVASPWTPDPGLAGESGEVAREYIWAALDCPSIWALLVQEPSDSTERAVSGRMAVQQMAPVRPREPHLVMAWAVGREKRTRTGGAAILSATGKTCAIARHTLVVTDWGIPLSPAHWR